MNNTELKLEDRNVDNTHPAELKRLYNEKHDKVINKFRSRKEFSIVSSIFFLFVAFFLYAKPILFDSHAAIVPAVIAVAFSMAIIIFNLYIKDELMQRKITNLLLD